VALWIEDYIWSSLFDFLSESTQIASNISDRELSLKWLGMSDLRGVLALSLSWRNIMMQTLEIRIKSRFFSEQYDCFYSAIPCSSSSPRQCEIERSVPETTGSSVSAIQDNDRKSTNIVSQEKL
jgi:hypothetical protein